MRLDRWKRHRQSSSLERVRNNCSEDQWRNRLTPQGEKMLDLVRGEHVSLLKRSERPHPLAVPVPERLLRLKSFCCLRNKYYTYRKRGRKATVHYKRKLSDQETDDKNNAVSHAVKDRL